MEDPQLREISFFSNPVMGISFFFFSLQVADLEEEAEMDVVGEDEDDGYGPGDL